MTCHWPEQTAREEAPLQMPHISIRQIQEAVSRSFRIPSIEMVSDRRAREVARPRQVAMYLARELTYHSLPRIGHFFGDRDHTTVLHGIREVRKRIAEDPALRRRISRLKRRLKEGAPQTNTCGRVTFGACRPTPSQDIECSMEHLSKAGAE